MLREQAHLDHERRTIRIHIHFPVDRPTQSVHRQFMHTLTVYLPDTVYSTAELEAKQRNLDVSTLCSGLLSDHFLRGFTAIKQPEFQSKGIPGQTAPEWQLLTAFNVAQEFRGFPHRSVEFAQAFVDEVLKIPRITAYKKGSEIGFDPNFVYIEALLSKGSRSGIRVSFFGRPEHFKNPPAVLKMGRPPSYSRAVIESKAELDAILPLIRQSYELRFGNSRR